MAGRLRASVEGTRYDRRKPVVNMVGSALLEWSPPRCVEPGGKGAHRRVCGEHSGRLIRVDGEHSFVVATIDQVLAHPHIRGEQLTAMLPGDLVVGSSAHPRGAGLLTCGNYVNNRIVDSVSVPVHRVSSPN